METKLFTWASFMQVMFKSYYVVWKLPSLSTTKEKDICLNRTMQYGNFFSGGIKKGG